MREETEEEIESQARVAYARLQALLIAHKNQNAAVDYNDRVVAVLFAAKTAAKSIVSNASDENRQDSDMFTAVKMFINRLYAEVKKERRLANPPA